MGLPLKIVPAADLRKIFNDLRLWERAQSGEYDEVVWRDGHPSPKRSGEPYCTRSQIIRYRDRSDRTVAIVHQYLRPDGTIGGAGRPDPKRLVRHGVIYAVTSPPRP
jgi:hypothetical protein